MRHAQVWPELHEQLYNSRIVGEDASRPTFDFFPYTRMKVLKGISHGIMLAELRTFVNGFLDA
jgi:hypothetical protein